MVDNPVSRFAETLRRSQWASPAQLAELQRGLVERLVRHASGETDFYPPRLRPVLGQDGRFDYGRWDEIPVLLRSDLQERQDQIRARSTPEATGAVVSSWTSGSTGTPMEFVKSALLTASSRAIVERAHDWADADRSQAYATIAVHRDVDQPPLEGRLRRGWSWMGGAGPHGLMPIEATLSAQVEFLARLKPAYLKTYSTNAAALARHADNHAWHGALRHVFTFGETLTDDHVETIRDALGVGVSSFYASEEAGQLATRCQHSGMYHVAAESALVEVLREDDTPCEPGETGRIVVTPFYNYAMPLIRYDQGDYAELAREPCGCGRVLPTIRRILGRSRDMFLLANGDRIWPRMPVPAMRKLLPAAAWQAVQHAVDLIEFKYVDDGSGREPDITGFEAFMQARYGPEVQVRLTRQVDIPRSRGGKFREFVSLVA